MLRPDANVSLPDGVRAPAVASSVLAARAAQKAWSALPMRERLKPFKEFRALLCRENSAIARTLSEENGKTQLEALSQEIVPVCDNALFLEKHAARILSPRKVKLTTRQFYFKGKDCEVRREPWGVVAVIGTWNYPFMISVTQILFALAAGNAVVFKGAPESPRVTALIGELLERAGFPRGLVRVFTGGREAGEELCRASCDKYVLTGSRATGRAVLRTLADTLKPAVMELSGADPYIILDDADWDLALRVLLWAAFQYSGQTCVAPRKVFIRAKDEKTFAAALARVWESCSGFLALQGTLRSPERAEDERRKIAALTARGARLLAGVQGGSGARVSPQVWVVDSVDAVADAEFMAPVFFVIACADDRAILEAASQGPFGLGASVWTRDFARAEFFVNGLRAGQVWVNDAIFSTALGEAPFGGAGESGFGRTRGPEGLLEMTQAKFVGVDRRKSRWTGYLPPYKTNDDYAALSQIQRLLFEPSFKLKMKAVVDLTRTGFK